MHLMRACLKLVEISILQQHPSLPKGYNGHCIPEWAHNLETERSAATSLGSAGPSITLIASPTGHVFTVTSMRQRVS